MDWQLGVAVLLLVCAIAYIVWKVRKNAQGEHDCPDCDLPVKKKKGSIVHKQ